MGKPAAKAKRGAAKVKDKPINFAAQSNLDYPLSTYKVDGRKLQEQLTERQNQKGGKAKKLSDYELYLLQKHFPSLEKKFVAKLKKDAATRRAARHAANKNAPLVTSDSDAPVFSRRAKEVLL